MKKNIDVFICFIIFFFFYSTLVIGFILDEDSSGGSKYDFEIHLETLYFFLKDTEFSLFNYNKLEGVTNSHSPIFIIFLKILHIFFGENLRFFYLNLCLLNIPIFFLILREISPKISLINSFLISNFFFLSPYFRSSAIWPGDENLSIFFLLLSIFFYIKYVNKIHIKKNNLNLFFHIFFLALTSYFRPIYSLLSIFFFYQMILKNFRIKIFFFYIFLNIFLSFPAIYYVFFLKINFFSSYLSFNIHNSIILFFTTAIFYLIPFIFFYNKKTTINKNTLILIILFTILIFIFFNYNLSTGGGLTFRILKYYLNNQYIFNIIFFLAFFLSVYYLFIFLEIEKKSNLILLILLIFFEIDYYFYQETYDPLLFICIFFLFRSRFLTSVINNLKLYKVFFIFSWLFVFYTIKVFSLNSNLINLLK